jgi:hypothetical protein
MVLLCCSTLFGSYTVGVKCVLCVPDQFLSMFRGVGNRVIIICEGEVVKLYVSPIC